MDYDDDVANQSVQWLYDHARRPQRNPFLSVGSFTHPHNPFTIAREYWDLYDHGEILGRQCFRMRLRHWPRARPVPRR